MLWSGRIQVAFDEQVAEGPAQIQFAFRPSPRVRYRFASRSPGVAAMSGYTGDERDVRLPIIETVPMPLSGQLWRPSSPGTRYTFRTSGGLPRATIGDPCDVSAVIVGLINFVDDELDGWTVLDGEEESRTGGELDVGPWHLTFWGRQSPPNGRQWWEPLEHAGSYAFTHAVEMRRNDGSVFDLADVEPLRDALFHVLSFAKGRLVGLALPVAYDKDGNSVAIRWETTIADPWTRPLSWFDHSLFGGLAGLLDRYLQLAREEFWQLVLRRAVRMTISANDPNPLDVSIPTAVAALELLAWSAESAGFSPELPPRATAATRIREFLRWAGIGLAVPDELQILATRAATRHAAGDAPDVLAGLRNRLMHPPNRPRQSDWPDGVVMREAWRLALEFAELGILRLLGYQGNYGHRRHLRGRWVGVTDPVPWARS